MIKDDWIYHASTVELHAEVRAMVSSLSKPSTTQSVAHQTPCDTTKYFFSYIYIMS
jgi:hypothetical protein